MRETMQVWCWDRMPTADLFAHTGNGEQQIHGRLVRADGRLRFVTSSGVFGPDEVPGDGMLRDTQGVTDTSLIEATIAAGFRWEHIR